MENIVWNVNELGSADRQTLEHLLGQPLAENQQLVIRVVTLGQPQSSSEENATAAGATLPDWCRVYEGLSDQQIAEVEKIALERANLSGPTPEL